MSAMYSCVKVRGRKRTGETKGPDCLTDRQADGHKLGIREYVSARERSIKTEGG